MNIDNYSLIKSLGFFQGFLRRGLRCLSTTLVLAFTAQSVFALRLNEVAPDFEVTVYVEGAKTQMRFHELIEQMDADFVILFSHPKDYTPVCTTELAKVEELMPEFKQLRTRILGLSADSYEDHHQWAKDILQQARSKKETLSFPLIVDDTLQVAKKFDMLPEEELPGKERTPKQNETIRALFLIDKDKKLRVSMLYPMNIGRNFDEVVRVIKNSLLIKQEEGRIASPANRKEGERMIVAPWVSLEEAKSLYGEVITVHLPSSEIGKPDYLRYVMPPELRLNDQGLDAAQAAALEGQTGDGEESERYDSMEERDGEESKRDPKEDL